MLILKWFFIYLFIFLFFFYKLKQNQRRSCAGRVSVDSGRRGCWCNTSRTNTASAFTPTTNRPHFRLPVAAPRRNATRRRWHHITWPVAVVPCRPLGAWAEVPEATPCATTVISTALLRIRWRRWRRSSIRFRYLIRAFRDPALPPSRRRWPPWRPWRRRLLLPYPPPLEHLFRSCCPEWPNIRRFQPD